MSNWGMGYDVIERSAKSAAQPFQRSIRFKQFKWKRDEIPDRTVLSFGIARTVPAGERREFNRLASTRIVFWEKRIEQTIPLESRLLEFYGKTFPFLKGHRSIRSKTSMWEVMARNHSPNFILELASPPRPSSSIQLSGAKDKSDTYTDRLFSFYRPLAYW